MFCNKCGKEIDDAAKFCPYCGEKITVPDIEETVKEEKLEEKSEKKSKKTGIVVAEIALIMVIGAGIGFGIWSTGAKAYINKYAKTIKSQKWESAYQYMNVENTDLSEEDYVKWADAYLSGIEDYTIEKISDDGNQKEYEISFTNDKGKEVFRNTYMVEKQDEKRAVFFPAWKIVKNAFIVECVEFCVPEGAEVFLDEVKLKEQPADENGMVPYQIPVMFVGPHSIKVTKEFYEDYEDVTFINADAVKDGSIVLALVLSDEIVKDVCFSVPRGAEFYLDDVKVEDTYLAGEETEGRITYLIPYMEKGEHKVKVVKENYNDYEEIIEITAQQESNPIALDMELNEGQAWRKAYYDFLILANEAALEELQNNGSDIDALYGAPPYDDSVKEISQLQFRLIYLNDDDIPEILLTHYCHGMLFTYDNGVVTAISLWDDEMGEYRGSKALLWGSRSFYGFTERNGLIMEIGSGGAASTGATFWRYTSGAKAEMLSNVYSDHSAPECSSINGNTVTWEEADAEIDTYMNEIEEEGQDGFPNMQYITSQILETELGYTPD